MKPYTVVHLNSSFKRYSMEWLKRAPVLEGEPGQRVGVDADIKPWLDRFNRLPFLQTVWSCAGHVLDERPSELEFVDSRTGKVVRRVSSTGTGLNNGYVEWVFTERAAGLWKDRYLQNLAVRKYGVPGLNFDISYRLISAGSLVDGVGCDDRAYLELWRVAFHYEHREFAMGVLWNTLREMKKERGLKVVPKR